MGLSVSNTNDDVLEQSLLFTELGGHFKSGNILQYSKYCYERGTELTYKTYEHFQRLIEAGLINSTMPELHGFRLWRGTVDEYYRLISLTECKGAELRAHSGKDGIHQIKDLLDNSDFVYWALDGVNPAFLRK